MELVPKKYYNTPLEKWCLLLGILPILDLSFSTIFHSSIVFVPLARLFGLSSNTEGINVVAGFWYISWVVFLAIYLGSRNATKQYVAKQGTVVRENDNLHKTINAEHNQGTKSDGSRLVKRKRILKILGRIVLGIVLLLLVFAILDYLVFTPSETRKECNEYAIEIVSKGGGGSREKRDQYDTLYTMCLRDRGMSVDGK